ncbi:WD40 repeat-like protein [Trametes polyzona]|nr:WD40 repeat-like protein [Trametes polyzona]
MVDPLQITADEVNCLIYAYFRDSGFQHSAFVLRAESHLEHSQHFGKNVPRGELVELLSKALLFSEVEAHWKGDKLTLSCRNPFNILERHVCSMPRRSPPNPAQPPSATGNTQTGDSTNGHSPSENALKRKASGNPGLDDGPKEKRAKTSSPVEVELDGRLGPSVEPRRASPQTSATSTDVVSAAATESAANKDHQNSPATKEKDHEDVPVQQLKAHKSEVFVCAWNPVDESILASGSKDSVVHIWDVPGPNRDGDVPPQSKPPLTCAYPPKEDQGDLTALNWSPDGGLLAIGCYDSVLRICDREGKVYFTHTQHDGPVFSTRFSPGGRWLASASLDGSACIWDVQGKRLHRHFSTHDKCCLDVDWISDSEFATCGSDGLIQIMNIDNPRPLRTLRGHTGEVNQVKVNTSKTRLASCSEDGTARIWNIEDIVYGRNQNDNVVALTGHNGGIAALAWSPHTLRGEHEVLVTASFDETTRLWDTVTGQCLRIFHDHRGVVYNLTFSPDGRRFATAGGDGWMHVYDVRVSTLPRKSPTRMLIDVFTGPQAKAKQWSYKASKSGMYEIAWQQTDHLNRIAMALANGSVAVVDVSRIPELQ